MKKILTASQMKKIDKQTIEDHGVPSLVLMERAALSVAISIMSNFPDASKIYVICGPGNNGGDGVAIARLLQLKGKTVVCTILGDSNKYSPQLQEEIAIAKSYNLHISYAIDESKIKLFDLVVDSMFGIGLTRGLEGEFLHAAEMINESANNVVAVDMPSGYDTDTGRLLGATGVHANMTITFAYMKKGLVLGDCKTASGDIQVADVGIYADKDDEKYASIVDDSIFSLIKPRPVDANKGTCGKLLIIAGSENIYGACYLSAKAALVTGAGLVKIFTHKNNISTIQNNLPEAMYIGFDSYDENELINAINWADVILVGPGLGTNDDSGRIVDTVLKYAKNPVVIDADGINIAAQKLDLLRELTARCPVTFTPHLKEMERLTSIDLKEIKYNIEKIATDFAEKNNCTVILKDSTTIIATPGSTSYIISGNEGLATPGSGDVLAGIVASFIGQNVNNDPDIAPIAATHLHGRAGRLASESKGIRGVLASDIIEELRVLL